MEKIVIFQLSHDYEGGHWKDMNFRIRTPKMNRGCSSGLTREGYTSMNIGGLLNTYPEGEITFKWTGEKEYD